MSESIPTCAVKAVIKNENDEILFLKRRAKRGGPQNWDLPGGLIEEDEKHTDTLQREIFEELGVKSSIGAEIGTWTFLRSFDGETVTATNFRVTLANDAISLSDEHITYGWFSMIQARQLPVKDVSIFEALV